MAAEQLLEILNMFQLILLKDVIHIAPYYLPIIESMTATTTATATATMVKNSNNSAINVEKASEVLATATEADVLSHPFHAVLMEQIFIKYANRVLPNHGLVITIHAIEKIGDVKIHPIDSGAHIECQFRCIIFKPLPGEIVVGTIKSSDPSGVLVSLDFFDWIVIPAAELQRPSTYDAKENVWIWKYEGHELYLDIGEQIRIRITDILYATQTLPTTSEEKPEIEPKEILSTPSARKPERVTIENCQPAMKVTATIASDGLGILSWWE